MNENLSINELIIYLFKAKRWTGAENTYQVWTDLLKDIDVKYVRKAVEKALSYEHHIDAGLLNNWAANYQNTAKYELKQHKHIPFITFCSWCLTDRDFSDVVNNIQVGDKYCTVCDNKYNYKKVEQIKDLYDKGLLNTIKKYRDNIINREFDWKGLDKFSEVMKKEKYKMIDKYNISI